MKSRSGSMAAWGLLAGASLLALAAPAQAATTCEGLAGLRLRDVEITAAAKVPAGDFQPPTGVAITGNPAFCRVQATARPTDQSVIGIEAWLPEAEAWNGRFLGTGNGGYAGGFQYLALSLGLQRGFAVVNTDMGLPGGGDAQVGLPERWKDWGYRATKIMTDVGKAIAEARYGEGPDHSYFSGCSTGGQQALREAQDYPHDYDGILAGAPANNRTHLHAWIAWMHRATRLEDERRIPLEKLQLVNREVLAQCGGKDGGSEDDAFLTDPRRCGFDPASLRCESGDAADCLTDGQVTALRELYEGPVNPRTGKQIYTGLPRGSELSALGIEASQAAPEPLFFSLFDWVFGAGYDWREFDFDRDLDRLDKALARILNANDPDLDGFERLGGKLMIYGGWEDPLVPPQDALHYYERVVADNRHGKGDDDRRGRGRGGHDGRDDDGDRWDRDDDDGKGHGGSALARTKEFARLFLVPGLAHCSGGNGPNVFGGAFQPKNPIIESGSDMLAALVRWVEQGVPPERIVGTKLEDNLPTGDIELRRPICAYPEIPSYVGGPVEDPDFFECRKAEKGGVTVPADRYLK